MRQRLQDIVLGALITAVFIAVGMFIVVQIPVAPYSSPVTISSVNYQKEEYVCPGDILNFDVTFDILRPDVITGFGSWHGEDGIIGSGFEIGIFPHAQERSVTEHISRGIPDFPPGEYRYVASIISVNLDTRPSFIEIPFTIGESCE